MKGQNAWNGMVQDFEVLAEVDLLATPERVVPSRQLPPDDPQSAEILPGMAAIAWRGDGRFLATMSCAGSGMVTASSQPLICVRILG